MRTVSRCLVFLFAAFVLVGWPLAAAASDPPGIKRVPAKWVPSTEGKALYDAYCKACHGTVGRGNGPAAKFLSVPVPDLTTIARRDGRFSVSHVQHHVLDEQAVDAVMPHWNEILRANYSGSTVLPIAATYNLAQHIEKMQVASPSR
jgi:hypothetical protein